MSDLAFSVTDSAPPRKRSPRTAGPNPFRQGLEESYEKNFAESDEWFEFSVPLENEEDPRKAVDRMKDRIRAAGQIEPKIGTEIRQEYDTGRVCFRGVEYSPRERKNKGNEADPYENEE